MSSANELKDGETTSPPLPTPRVSTSPSCKRRSEDGEKMVDPASAHSRPKRCRGRPTIPVDPVKELAVRMKRQLQLEIVSSASAREDSVDPLSDPIPVRIRSKDVNNLFLIIDPRQRKPVMGFISEDDEDAIFILRYFCSEEYGEICTLFHKASGGYLAVDQRTDQPIVRCQTHPPVCSSPDSDLSLHQPPGARPEGGEDNTDSSPPSDPPEPDPCCFFGSVSVGEEACLIPKVCHNKCLSYNQKTLEVWTVAADRWDFVLLDAEDEKTTLSRS